MKEILRQLDTLAQEKEENNKQKIEKIKTDIKNLFHTQNNALSPTALYQEQQQSKEVQQVIQVVNQLLKDNLQWKSCTIKQNKIVHKRQEMFGYRQFNYTWLDIMEKSFREAGWKVSYDKPWMGESYDAYFSFNIIK
jgi:ElaB/YqjD/DUF883 family membrane-anchored ribosome-binding protein